MPYITSIEQMAAEKGRIEARLETQSEIALNLLRQNIAVDVIVQATGLTVEQVQTLQAGQQDN
jgi:predicted transposase/invertase (TIGR01784 family)